jgi:hypothetical protein
LHRQLLRGGGGSRIALSRLVVHFMIVLFPRCRRMKQYISSLKLMFC